MNERVKNSLEVVAVHGRRLREVWHYDWTEPHQQAVCRLRVHDALRGLPPLVAVVGGASSGKSTVFNNLLDGHVASRVTARGHATLGPILAVHEDHRESVESLLADGRLLPGCRRAVIELEGNASGESEVLVVVFHGVEPLRDVLLFDTPDFTSDAASREGDVSLSLLPWFDRMLIVVDHERWFDRQSISKLRGESVRFGQQRLVLFNRTRETALREEDRAALTQQAERLAAEAMVVLEFRRGRGFCRFAPGALSEVHSFLGSAAPERSAALLQQIGNAAASVRNQHEERVARLKQLRASLDAAAARLLPQPRECMTALMTAEERRHMDPIWRILRTDQTRRWLLDHTRRIQTALSNVPLLGAVLPRTTRRVAFEPSESAGRFEIAASYFESVSQRRQNEIRRIAHGSAFWDEIRRWTGLEPSGEGTERPSSAKGELEATVRSLDDALRAWTEKVEAECGGISPHVRGAVGVGAVALAAVLIAVPGPVTALSLLAAKGAITAALGHLLVAGGAGAMLGKQMGRLTVVLQEKLMGSAEFDAVRVAAESYRMLIEAAGRREVSQAMVEASSLVIPPQDPLIEAMEVLSESAQGRGR